MTNVECRIPGDENDLPGDVDMHCPECGYNLRGLPSNRCPECGASFVLADAREVVLAGGIKQAFRQYALVLKRPRAFWSDPRSWVQLRMSHVLILLLVAILTCDLIAVAVSFQPQKGTVLQDLMHTGLASGLLYIYSLILGAVQILLCWAVLKRPVGRRALDGAARIVSHSLVWLACALPLAAGTGIVRRQGLGTGVVLVSAAVLSGALLAVLMLWSLCLYHGALSETGGRRGTGFLCAVLNPFLYLFMGIIGTLVEQMDW